MSKKGKRASRPKDVFDPEAYQDLLQSLLLKAQLPEVPSTYLLEQLTRMDPEGTLAKRLKASDLDGLSMRDRGSTVWQVMEQTALDLMGRLGQIEPLSEEEFVAVEIVDWDTYARRTGGSGAIGPLKDLSATDICIPLKFNGHLENIMRAAARHTHPELDLPGLDSVETLLKPKFINDIPGHKNVKTTVPRGDEPSATLMLLILRLAMALHLATRHPEEDHNDHFHAAKVLSISLFTVLFNNNNMYMLWKLLVAGKPRTRQVDNGMGGYYFEWNDGRGLED